MTARITTLADVHPRPRTVAIGIFDGVHLGHREVVRGADTVLTFDPHPMAVLRPSEVPARLTTRAQQAQILGELGVQELVLAPFDESTAHQSAPSFIEDVLVGRLDARCVRIGDNFRFGHGATGTAALLGDDSRFDTVAVPLLRVDGQPVSSTRIRQLISHGEVADARRLLGAPFTLGGEISHGEQRGRTLGFPTANLEPPDGHMLPAFGVYACRATIDGETSYAAAVSIGVRPQFETALGVLVEAYLLDYDGDLYGHRLDLEFLERLRGEQRFDGVDALIQQMQDDVAATRRIVTG